MQLLFDPQMRKFNLFKCISKSKDADKLVPSVWLFLSVFSMNFQRAEGADQARHYRFDKAAETELSGGRGVF